MSEANDHIGTPGPIPGPRPPDASAPWSGSGAPVPPDRIEDTAITHRTSPLRRHPIRWTVAAGGLALVLTLGGYGVTSAATSSNSPTTTETAAHRVGTGAPPRRSGSGPSSSHPSGSASLGGPPGAGGAGGGPPGAYGSKASGGRAGEVTAISGDTITLTTPTKATVTAIVTSSTVFRAGTHTSTLGALKQGDLVVVTGSTSSDGTVTAKTVTFGIAPSGTPGKNTPPSGA